MNNIKQLRARTKMTQNILAEKMGVSRSTVAMWETEASQPDNDMLKKLSEVLDSSIDYILGVTEIDKKETPIENDEQEDSETISEYVKQLNSNDRERFEEILDSILSGRSDMNKLYKAFRFVSDDESE